MTINFDNIDDLYIEEPHYLGPSAKQKLYVNDTLIWAKMTVYFDENTGSSVNNKTVYYKRTYGTLPTTSKTGHTFNGWFTDETWGTKVTEETICNQVDNHTLYAKLDINYYTITFKNYQGSVVDTQSVSYGSTPSTPSGTADTAQYEYSWPTINSATKNITYQETRTVKRYVVMWYKYGKTGQDYAKIETLDYGSVSLAPTGTPDTAQYDYNWPQWSVTVNGPATVIETRALKYYTITFKNYAGSVVDTQSVSYGSTPSIPSGTADTVQYDYSWPSVSTATANITYQETRTIKKYFVIWSSYNNEVLKSDYLNYGSVSTAPTGTSDTDQYDYNWPKSSTTVTGSETISETRALKYYTVTWKDWDNTTLTAQSVAYGGNGTPPTQPTRTGYTFNTWSGNYTGITGNVTITATYRINYYAVTFEDWNGTTLTTQLVAYGGNATPPTQPTRTGYTFSGWSGNYTGITGNVTITATYTANYYTVTFKDWNGTTLKTQSVSYNGNATPPSNPTRTGYTFSGWSGTYTNVTSNRTITAVYTFSPTITAQWQFVAYYSSEPDNYDLYLTQYINGDYEQGLYSLSNNYPAGDYNEGFVAVISDLSTLNYFEYVVVAI